MTALKAIMEQLESKSSNPRISYSQLRAVVNLLKYEYGNADDESIPGMNNEYIPIPIPAKNDSSSATLRGNGTTAPPAKRARTMPRLWFICPSNLTCCYNWWLQLANFYDWT